MLYLIVGRFLPPLWGPDEGVTEKTTILLLKVANGFVKLLTNINLVIGERKELVMRGLNWQISTHRVNAAALSHRLDDHGLRFTHVIVFRLPTTGCRRRPSPFAHACEGDTAKLCKDSQK